MWCEQPTVVELYKGDHGLGFSILDYQVVCQIIFILSKKSIRNDTIIHFFALLHIMLLKYFLVEEQ